MNNFHVKLVVYLQHPKRAVNSGKAFAFGPPSVLPCVRPSVRPSVRKAVRSSIHQLTHMKGRSSQLQPLNMAKSCCTLSRCILISGCVLTNY